MRKWLSVALAAVLGAAWGCEADKPDEVVVADLRKPLGPKNDVAVRLEMPAGKPSLAYQEATDMPRLGPLPVPLPVVEAKPRASSCEIEGKPGGAWTYSIGRPPIEGPLVPPPIDDGLEIRESRARSDGDWGYGVVRGDAARATAPATANVPAQPGMTVNVIVSSRPGGDGVVAGVPGTPGLVVGSVSGEGAGFGVPRRETTTGADTDLRQQEGSVVGTGAGQGGPTGFGRNTIGADWDDVRANPSAPSTPSAPPPPPPPRRRRNSTTPSSLNQVDWLTGHSSCGSTR